MDQLNSGKEKWKMITIRKMENSPYDYSKYKNEIILLTDNWDDYSYRTTFCFKYIGRDGKICFESYVQIYCESLEEEIIQGQGPVWTKSYIPETIEQLDASYCSLGQNLRYYESLKQYLPNDYKDVLKRLNDLAYDERLWEQFKEKKGVQVSLLRSSSAEKARKEAHYLFNENENELRNLSFSYTANVPYTSKNLTIHFGFDKRKEIPYRINALVGKNGTGKTTILKDLAMDISGFVDKSLIDRYGSITNYLESKFLNGERPVFDKIISISYSVFDPFDKRIGSQSLDSYVYCGVQTDHGVLSFKEIKEKFISALRVVHENKRTDIWEKVIRELFQNEQDDIIKNIFAERYDKIQWSSGQNILLLSMTEAIANIEKESIILLDEPELHLHPNAIANFMRMLSEVLEYFDSYAIVSTHSPIILQEIPSSNVNILYKIDNMPFIRQPEVECFGENITRIVQDVFSVKAHESGYQSVFRKLKDKGMKKQEVYEIFSERELGLNASIFIEHLYRNEGDTSD